MKNANMLVFIELIIFYYSDAVKKRITNSKTSLKEKTEDCDVYELAHQTLEENDYPAQRMSQVVEKSSSKPSPKPRGSASNRCEISVGDLSQTSGSSDLAEVPLSSPDLKKDIDHGRRRPGKKVVEIEYEIAKNLRSRKSVEKSKDSKPYVQYSMSVPSPGHLDQLGGIQMEHSASQPTKLASQAEGLYEEPWDLKAKRLKVYI